MREAPEAHPEPWRRSANPHAVRQFNVQIGDRSVLHRKSVLLVHGEGEHAIIPGEYLRRPIALVHVQVNHEDAGHAIPVKRTMKVVIGAGVDW